MNKMFNIPFAVLLLACCMQNLDAGGCQRNQPPAQPTPASRPNSPSCQRPAQPTAPSCPRQYKPRPTTPATLEDENAAISASLRGAVNGLISGFDKLKSDLDNFLVGGTEFTMGYKTLKDAAIVLISGFDKLKSDLHNFLVGGTEFTMGYKTLKDAAIVSGNSPASLQLKLDLDQYVKFLWRVIDDINRSGDSQAAQRNIDIITSLRSAVNTLEGSPEAQQLESGLDKLESGLDKFTTNYKTLRNAANALGDSQASLQLKSALYRYVDFHKRVIDEISLLGNSQAAQQQAVPAE